MNFHSLHGNPLFDLKEWGVYTKKTKTHILAATYPKISNLVPILSMEIAV